jgi:dihydroxyacid dehydratase/phosphogluconate dehydratase
VAKITGKEGLGFVGKARAFDSEDEFVAAVESGSIKKGEKTVVILRYLGPQGGPGQSKLFSTMLPQQLAAKQPIVLWNITLLSFFFPSFPCYGIHLL